MEAERQVGKGALNCSNPSSLISDMAQKFCASSQVDEKMKMLREQLEYDKCLSMLLFQLFFFLIMISRCLCAFVIV